MAGLRSFLPLAAVFLATGCAASGPPFTDAPPSVNKALVYIYRPYDKWVGIQDAGFDANGKRIGFLNPGGYTYFHAPPGHYDIRQFWPMGLWTLQEPALWKDLHVMADLNAGETRYIRLQVRETGSSQCPGPTTSVIEPDGSESRYFNVGTYVYDPANVGAGPSASWCIGMNLAEVRAEVGRGEILAQKFQTQNRAMPTEYKP